MPKYIDTKINELVINETTEELLKTQEIQPNQIYITEENSDSGSSVTGVTLNGVTQPVENGVAKISFTAGDYIKIDENNKISADLVDFSIDIDSELSLESENPVQNKIITEEISNINNRIADVGTQFDNYLPLTGGTLSGDLIITGNITQHGEQYITHAEQIYTKNDYIILREDATEALPNKGNSQGLNPYSGLEFVKYDGTHNGRIVIDNQGIARVGDAGDEQPLSTREESPINGGYAKWDSNTNKFITEFPLRVPPATKNTIGGLRAWIDENLILHLSSKVFENIALGDGRLEIMGAIEQIQQGIKLKLR